MKRENLIQKNYMIETVKLLHTKIIEDDIFALASQLSYNLILAFFPFLIFLLTLVGRSRLDSKEVLVLLNSVLPQSAYDLIKNTVIEVVDVQQNGLLWFSIALAVWTSASGFSAVIKGINMAYEVEETRSYIKLKLVSILFTLALAILIVVTIFLLVFGDLIGNYFLGKLPFDEAIRFAWNMSRIIILISMMVFVFAALYHYTPCRRLGWAEVLPGAILCTFGWIVISYGFEYYVNNFSNYSRLYGSLGAVVVLMTWIFLTSLIMIVGGEINAVLAYEK